MIWLSHISVFHVRLFVYAGGCVSVWGDIGMKLFPWRWRWLPNRAEWNSLAHSLSKFINLFWEVHDWTKNSNKLGHLLKMDQKEQDVTWSFVISLLTWATKHFTDQTSVFNCRELFKTISKAHLLTSFLSLPFREVYNFSKYSDEAVKTFKEHRGAMHSVTAMLVAKDLKIDG